MPALPEDLRVTTSIDPASIPWATLERDWGTTYMQLLRCSVEENSFTNMIRYPAGVTLATHLHTGPVDVYTFSGRWRYLEYDWQATAGTYAHEPAGTVHTLRIEEETLALFIVNGGFVYFNVDGSFMRYQDAATTLKDTQAALAGEGLELPVSVYQ
jgi:quercetin dioxygenase-like cupin family protein